LDIDCDMTRDQVRNVMVTNVDKFLNSGHVSNNMVNEYFEKMKKIHIEMMTKITC
jgi:hypothetical protein